MRGAAVQLSASWQEPGKFTLPPTIIRCGGLQKSGIIQYRDAAVFLVTPGSPDRIQLTIGGPKDE